MQSVPTDRVSRDGFITVDGHKLKFRRLFPRQSDLRRPVLVFLHEGLGDIEMWGDFPHLLASAAGCEALLYDRLGHGGSDPFANAGFDPDYQQDEAFRYLPAVLDHFDLHRCVLIGHSDGGTLALLYTAAFPQRVAAIVTEAAHVFVDHLTTAGIRRTVEIYRAGGRFKQKLAAHHGAEKAEALVRRWSVTWLDPRFAQWNVEHVLPRILCPVMALQGAEDEYGVPEQARSIAAGVGGHGEAHLIPDCRHMPHLQARDVVVNHILRFLATRGVL